MVGCDRQVTSSQSLGASVISGAVPSGASLAPGFNSVDITYVDRSPCVSLAWHHGMSIGELVWFARYTACRWSWWELGKWRIRMCCGVLARALPSATPTDAGAAVFVGPLILGGLAKAWQKYQEGCEGVNVLIDVL